MRIVEVLDILLIFAPYSFLFSDELLAYDNDGDSQRISSLSLVLL